MIRLATLNDYNGIISIWNKNTKVLFRPFRKEIENELINNKYIVYTLYDKIVGFVGYKYMPRKNCYKIIHLCVDKDYRNQHIGKELLFGIVKIINDQRPISLIEHLQPIIIECVSGADNNIFWEKYGSIIETKHLKSMDIKVIELKGV